MNRIINVVSNKNYETKKVKRKLISKLETRGYEVSPSFDTNAELTISIGGDGAFLKTVHENRFPRMPIVGINTGTLGFFQEIDPDEIDEFLDDYELGRYKTTEINLLKAEVVTKGRTFNLHGVNEISLKGQPSKIIQMNVYIDGNHLEKFAGDGMMISSPTGSTAYNMSIGGAVIHQAVKAMQMTPMAPINSKAYRSLGSPLIVPQSTQIVIRPLARYKNSSRVVVDGTEKTYYKLNEVRFTVSDLVIKTIQFKKDFYWHNLKDKFL